eukprot:COSAG03_NODE_3377_length_2050_cov_3.098924_1_plen_61_part_10
MALVATVLPVALPALFTRATLWLRRKRLVLSGCTVRRAPAKLCSEQQKQTERHGVQLEHRC